VIQRCVARNTDMRTVWLDDISASYALTLGHWRERFLGVEPELDRLGYDRRFRRLWEMYLAISEAGFREARLVDLQIVFAKPGWRAGLARLAAGDAHPAPAAARQDL
jgi:cyclopropane-fatty-acyl-phospholipid synthase